MKFTLIPKSSVKLPGIPFQTNENPHEQDARIMIINKKRYMQDVSLKEGVRNKEGKEKRRRGKDESENQKQTQQPLRFEARLL